MGTVLQYTLVYCSKKGMRKAVCNAIQTGCAGRGAGHGQAWASGKGAGARDHYVLGARGAAKRQPRAVTRPGGPATTRPDPPMTRPRTRGLCAQARPSCCTVHLTQF